jgi:hypothetical protein
MGHAGYGNHSDIPDKPHADPERPDPHAKPQDECKKQTPERKPDDRNDAPSVEELKGVSTVPQGRGGSGKQPSGGAGYNGPQGDEVDPGTG